MVTGAASGLGFAICKLLIGSGCTVICIDKDQEALTRALRECGSRAEGLVGDVTNFTRLQAIIREIEEKHGRIDYFFNNAGIVVMGEARDITIEDWNAVLDVDLHGTINGVAAVYPLMVRQKSGHIVNISSITGITPAMMLLPYVTAKYGIVGLSHSLRMEAKRLGINVSVACPSFINTPIWTRSKVCGSKAVTPVEFLTLFWSQPLLPAEQAAKIILKGVMKNKATILNDFLSRLFWWSYRISPTLWMWLYEALFANRFRCLRK